MSTRCWSCGNETEDRPPVCSDLKKALAQAGLGMCQNCWDNQSTLEVRLPGLLERCAVATDYTDQNGKTVFCWSYAYATEVADLANGELLFRMACPAEKALRVFSQPGWVFVICKAPEE